MNFPSAASSSPNTLAIRRSAPCSVISPTDPGRPTGANRRSNSSSDITELIRPPLLPAGPRRVLKHPADVEQHCLDRHRGQFRRVPFAMDREIAPQQACVAGNGRRSYPSVTASGIDAEPASQGRPSQRA